MYNTFVSNILLFDSQDTDQLLSLLKRILPPGQLDLLRLVADEAATHRLPLYIVGGFVRDLLLGRPSLDFDLVVEGDAIAFARSVSQKYGGKVTAHTHFGTASWPASDSSNHSKVPTFDHANLHMLDFISARSETYAHPGALPTVRKGTLVDDLRRRDFTINTLAIRLDGEHFGQLYDELSGLEDLRKGLVRVLHSASYADDPTRILRAVRYEQRYGFRIAEEDLAWIAGAKSGLSFLSGERLRHELDLILVEEKASAMLFRLNELDLLENIHPLLRWDASLSQLLEDLKRPKPDSWKGVPNLPHIPRRVALSYLLWLRHLSSAAIEELSYRLDFTAGLRDALMGFSGLQADLPALVGRRPSAVVARLDGYPLLVVCAAWLIVNVPTRAILENYLAHWRHVWPRTTGSDLIKRGLPPGPAFRVILSGLRTAWLDGELKTKEDELALLDKLTKSV